MILKLLAVGFLVVFLAKLLFFRRLGDFKAWADRLANLFLIAIGIYFVAHFLVLSV